MSSLPLRRSELIVFCMPLSVRFDNDVLNILGSLLQDVVEVAALDSQRC